MRKQHLTDDSKTDDIVQIVKDVSGLHATIPKTPYSPCSHEPRASQGKR
jgi:hypothetical protein